MSLGRELHVKLLQRRIMVSVATERITCKASMTLCRGECCLGQNFMPGFYDTASWFSVARNTTTCHVSTTLCHCKYHVRRLGHGARVSVVVAEWFLDLKSLVLIPGLPLDLWLNNLELLACCEIEYDNYICNFCGINYKIKINLVHRLGSSVFAI